MRHLRPSPPSRALLPRRALVSAAVVVAATAAGTTAVLAWPRRPAPAPTAGAPSSTPSATPSASPSPETSPSPAASTDPVAGWSVEQIVGQLLMAGVPAEGSAQEISSLLEAHHVGGVFLSGRSRAGLAATRALVDEITASAAAAGQAAPLLVSTDQEGGNVQVLSGSGFTEIPEATTQGS